MTTIKLTAIPCTVTMRGGKAYYDMLLSDAAHPQNVVETRTLKVGKITDEDAKRMAHDCAALALAERPARYPDTVCVTLDLPKGQRAPVGWRILTKQHHFAAAEVVAA